MWYIYYITLKDTFIIIIHIIHNIRATDNQKTIFQNLRGMDYLLKIERWWKITFKISGGTVSNKGTVLSKFCNIDIE